MILYLKLYFTCCSISPSRKRKSKKDGRYYEQGNICYKTAGGGDC